MSEAKPGQDLALALSGGGYRATAFHLGVMDMLERLGLREKVQALSTISGGTLFGALYLRSLAREEPWPVFIKRSRHWLATTNIMLAASEHLAGKRGAQAASLVRAAARVYAREEILGETTLASVGALESAPADILMGATEFRHGLPFRFQTSRRSPIKMGGGQLRVSEVVASQIRLADILAASSCFPSVFEPLRFPHDFAWENPPEVREKLGSSFNDPLPLMDGGIHDNQGFDGIERVLARDGMNERFALILLSDASRSTPRLLDMPEQAARGGLTPATFRVLLMASLTALVVTLMALSFRLWRDLGVGASGQELALVLVPLMAVACLVAGLGYLLAEVQKNLKWVRSRTNVKVWAMIRQVPISELLLATRNRVDSLARMSSGVFMNRGRRQTYDKIFQNPDLRDRVVPIRLVDLDVDLNPSSASRELGRKCEEVPTQLWLNGEQQCDDLVACGQIASARALAKWGEAHGAAWADEARKLCDLLAQNPRGLVDPGPSDALN